MVNSELEERRAKIEEFFILEFGREIQGRVWTLRRGIAPWDSLRHIELINAFESKFSIALNFEEAIRLSSPEEFLQILSTK